MDRGLDRKNEADASRDAYLREAKDGMAGELCYTNGGVIMDRPPS